jgi:DNA polymerase-1
VGPKTAALLMKEFASLDELYADLERVDTLKMRGALALGSRLRAHRDAAYLARQLTGIVCEVPLEGGSERLRRRLPDLPGLASFYDKHRFGPFLRRQGERLAELPLNLS